MKLFIGQDALCMAIQWLRIRFRAIGGDDQINRSCRDESHVFEKKVDIDLCIGKVPIRPASMTALPYGILHSTEKRYSPAPRLQDPKGSFQYDRARRTLRTLGQSKFGHSHQRIPHQTTSHHLKHVPERQSRGTSKAVFQSQGCCIRIHTTILGSFRLRAFM